MAAFRGGLHSDFRVFRSFFPVTSARSMASRSRALRAPWPPARSSNTCSRVRQSASVAASIPFESISASAKEGSRSLTLLSSCQHAAPAGSAVTGEGPSVALLPLSKLHALRLPFCLYSISHSPDAPLKLHASFPAHADSRNTPEGEGGGPPEGAPPPAKSGAAEGGAHTAVRVEFDVSRLPGTENARDGLMALIFTCCKCNTRAAKKFSKVAYYNGVVIVRCPTCRSLHLVADRLKWFGDEASDIESILAAKGEAVLRSLAEAHCLDVEGMDTPAVSQTPPVN